MENLKHMIQQLPVGATIEIRMNEIPRFSEQVVFKIRKNNYFVSGGANSKSEEDMKNTLTDLILEYNRNGPL